VHVFFKVSSQPPQILNLDLSTRLSKYTATQQAQLRQTTVFSFSCCPVLRKINRAHLRHSVVHVAVVVGLIAVVISRELISASHIQEAYPHPCLEHDAQISMTVVDGGGLTSTLPEMF
jgi:hypothetical protein